MEEGIHVAIAAEKLGEFLGIPITNTLVTSWLVIGLLVALAFFVRGRLAMVPNRLQTLLEEAFTFVYDYVAETLESREMARKFFPLLMTIFLFIFVGNMIHFIPGIGSLEYNHLPFLRAPNTDLTVPLVLALVSFFVIEFTGIMAIGVWKYGSKFVVNPLTNPIGFAVGLIELIGELVRVVSLSFRLFGNILAGEVIIAVAIFFAPYFAPVPLMMFEIFIGFLQAAIFALLTLFFIKLAIEEPHAEAH
ncbi:ATP synthase F0 subunit A [Candidatus Kaiserbacteria bacterium RIFCSPHIGHO2_01_FULL_55_17]|uniref:ATP synthase subunit a n=1 Tax=Candidatus Kaiserbacteria bacterium RIFCSPHIGHO2_01_FULL_55_17 TaxID=1798484 RepID=A0A1F6D7B3_9BACT|nr:MAG: ATP synthase F0 subunit A [Candidatus Kaiserbacteria bacterium RIFCSPHIGHO2_01_FULL_55_17]